MLVKLISHLFFPYEQDLVSLTFEMHSVNTRGFYFREEMHQPPPQPPKLKRYYTFLCPATLAAITFILLVLTIIAGQQHDFAHSDDYSIVYVCTPSILSVSPANPISYTHLPSQFNTSTLGQGLLNDTSSLKNRSAPLPVATESPNLLPRYHAAPDKRFGISDIDSAAAELSSAAGQSAAAAAASAAAPLASAVTSAAANASSLGHLVQEAKSELETIKDNLADELHEKLGIQQWYAVHLTNLCYGNFTPTATAANATWGARNCTAPFRWGESLNLTSMLNHSLAVGPYQLSLADIGLARDAAAAVDDALDLLRACLEAVFVMYMFAAAFVGLSVALSACAVFALKSNEVQEGQWAPTLARRTKQVFFHGTACATAAGWAFLLAGNVVTTWGGRRVVDAVRSSSTGAGRLGLQAFRGGRFLAMTWGAFAVFCFVLAYWAMEEWADWRRGRKYAPAKAAYLAKYGGDGYSSRGTSADLEKVSF